MRVNFFFFLAAVLVFGALFVMPATALAQDIFLKKGGGASSSESSESATKKLYLSPRAGSSSGQGYNRNKQGGPVYNGDARRESRRTGPSTTVSRNNELDRIQQANIEAAQKRSARNAQILAQKRKTWEAERAAADEEARAQEMAEQENQQQGEGSSTESRDMSNATYLKQNPMDAPKRTFDIFR